MSIYVPAHFKVEQPDAIRDLVREYPFATLVTAAQPEPFVSHVPLLMTDERTLVGHFARANPHAQLDGAHASIAVFHGPHAYVSPSWYEEPGRAVPTWNYATVHVRGVLEATDDLDQAQKVLDALIERFEGARREPWSFRMAEPQRTAMLKAIRAFRFRIEDVTGKFKMSQNRGAGDRRRVMSALREEGYAEASATARWMERYAPV